jgi:hypothetical protein
MSIPCNKTYPKVPKFLTLVFDLLNENFNLQWLYLLIGRYWGFDISHDCSLWQDLSIGTKIFDLVTWTLMFDLLIKNFNLGYNI